MNRWFWRGVTIEDAEKSLNKLAAVRSAHADLIARARADRQSAIRTMTDELTQLERLK